MWISVYILTIFLPLYRKYFQNWDYFRQNLKKFYFFHRKMFLEPLNDFQGNFSTKFEFLKNVDNFTHITHTGIYKFWTTINNLLTNYPLIPVDNRTVVLK